MSLLTVPYINAFLRQKAILSIIICKIGHYKCTSFIIKCKYLISVSPRLHSYMDQIQNNFSNEFESVRLLTTSRMIIVCTISSCSSNTQSKIQSLYYLLSFKFLYNEKNTWQASFPIHDTKNLYYVIILMFLSQDWYKSIFRQQNIIIDVLFFKTSKDLHLPVSTV